MFLEKKAKKAASAKKNNQFVSVTAETLSWQMDFRSSDNRLIMYMSCCGSEMFCFFQEKMYV